VFAVSGECRDRSIEWGRDGLCSRGVEYGVHYFVGDDGPGGDHALYVGIYVYPVRLPWISRSSHAEMMGLLTTQLGELKAERQILLDRLATLGLGGPLFSSISSGDSSETEEAVDPEAEELEKLMTSRRRPSKLADALTRKAYRDYNRVRSGASVKWVSRVETVTAALDEAEALGKNAALSG
jgi:hypothetical protein